MPVFLDAYQLPVIFTSGEIFSDRATSRDFPLLENGRSEREEERGERDERGPSRWKKERERNVFVGVEAEQRGCGCGGVVARVEGEGDGSMK